jgi:hypothetical protein
MLAVAPVANPAEQHRRRTAWRALDHPETLAHQVETH